MQFGNARFNKGKIVYYINGQSFENDKSLRNGKDKAIKYCLDNFLNPNDIKRFDSRTERDRFVYLEEQQKKGLISNLAHHFNLLVQEEFININGDLIPAITYETDFIYYDNIKQTRVVEDVKGSEYFIDENFIMLKKIFDKIFINKKLYLKVVLHRDKERVEYKLGEKKKSQKLIKKQREKINLLNQQKKEQEKEKKRIDRLKKSRETILKKDKKTKQQLKKLIDIEKELSDLGVIIS